MYWASQSQSSATKCMFGGPLFNIQGKTISGWFSRFTAFWRVLRQLAMRGSITHTDLCSMWRETTEWAAVQSLPLLSGIWRKPGLSKVVQTAWFLTGSFLVRLNLFLGFIVYYSYLFIPFRMAKKKKKPVWALTLFVIVRTFHAKVKIIVNYEYGHVGQITSPNQTLRWNEMNYHKLRVKPSEIQYLVHCCWTWLENCLQAVVIPGETSVICW